MISSSHALLSLFFTASLLAGCASTGSTPSGTAEASAAADQVSPTTQASKAAKKKLAGGAEPECD